jgi:hypothetical protein
MTSPNAGDHQEQRLDPARAEAVEEQPERQLEGGKGEKVGGGEQAEVGRHEGEVAGQIRGDDGVDDAEDVGEEVAEGEREGDAQQGLGAVTHDEVRKGG